MSNFMHFFWICHIIEELYAFMPMTFDFLKTEIV
uniref:Uncharacterized protein n=1 Tax=Rhizophora mucronata TaxID=61149 RepID=A0A2P2PEQ0_RHIMU